jgi:tRNA modification GTPase
MRADMRVFLVNTGSEVPGLGVASEPGDVTVLGKADLRGACKEPAVSGATGLGVDELLARIEAELRERVATVGTVTNDRQRAAVRRMVIAAGGALEQLRGGAPEPELVAEDLRAALRAIDFLAGRVDVEAVLDVIFSSFCIGK